MAVTTTATEIIKRAMRIIGATDTGETPDASEMADALRILNHMIMGWQNRGYLIWQYAEAVLYFVKEQAQYAIGSDHAALHGDTTNKTELSTAGAAADLTIEVDSISGISTGDVIGIELDDDTIQWTTVNGAPTGTTITITAALTGAAAVDNHVYAYTTILARPLQIWNPRLVNGDDSDNETPIGPVLGRSEYMTLNDKASSGKVNQIYYDPQRTYGQLYVWPTPDNVQDRLNFTCQVVLTEFSTLATAPDCDPEWFEAMEYNLAYRLAPEYGLSLQERMALKSDAEEYLSLAESAHIDPAPISFEPDMGP